MTSSHADPWFGRLIGDRYRYRLDKRLGQGGTADVFLAMDTLLRQPVAVKLLHGKLLAGEMRARFEREVTLCAALKNEHIVQVSDYGVTSEGYPFFVMEYLQGQTLRQVLHNEKRLPVERAASILIQICIGLSLAHQGVELWQDGATVGDPVKIIHRDLKPDNIFLVSTSLGELAKILDFGIAKIQSEQAGHSNATNAFLGTYRYAAPEQFEVERDINERTDIYSLGIIMYEMLSGMDPFGLKRSDRHISGGTWAVAHLTKLPLPLRQQPDCEEITPELEAVVMRCLQKAPDQRFSSVYELDQALKAAVWGESTVTLVAAHPLEVEFAGIDLFSPTLELPQAALVEATAVTRNINSIFTLMVDQLAQSSSPLLRRRPQQIGAVLVATMAVAIASYYWLIYSASTAVQQQNLIATPQPAIASDALMADSSSAAIRTLAGHTDTIWAVATSADRHTLASGSFDRTIRLWNTQTGALIRVLTGHEDAVRSMAFSSDGKILASGSGDKTIRIWNAETGELLRTLTGHSGPVWSVAISPEGKILASGAYDGTIKVWNFQTGELLYTLPEHYDSVWSVTISPDGRTLVSGAYDGTIKVWNLETGTLVRTLTGHTDAVRSVAIHSDGKTLVSCSWDKTVRVWNLQTGTMLQTLLGHSDRVLSVAISPSGQTIASGSLDNTIRVWNLETGTMLRTLSEHSDWVISVAFSANSEIIVSGSKDKTVKLWSNVP